MAHARQSLLWPARGRDRAGGAAVGLRGPWANHAALQPVEPACRPGPGLAPAHVPGLAPEPAHVPGLVPPRERELALVPAHVHGLVPAPVLAS